MKTGPTESGQAASVKRTSREHRRDDSGHHAEERGNGLEDRLICATCGTAVPEGARSCPVCHRGVFRTCFCGWHLPANQRSCPNCGADWSQSARVARKSRSRTPNTRKLVRYALIGALAAAAAMILVLVVMTGFARLGMSAGEEVPGAVGDRLALAAAGAARLARLIWAFFVRYGAAILSVIGIMIVGAGAGIVVYLRRGGRREPHTSRTSRRVRRKRRQ